MPRLVATVVASALALAGCVLDPVDLEGRLCPCTSGYVCDPARRVCVRDEGAADGGSDDAATADGSIDAPGPDGGGDAGFDASVEDASEPTDAGVDAGELDAGIDAGADAGPDSTGCDDVHATALFCDGYEDAALASWDWATETSGTAVRTTTGVHRGAGALRSQTTAGSGRASRSAVFPTVTSGDLWFRAWFFVPSSVTISGISLLYVGENTPPYDGIALQTIAGGVYNTWVGPENRSFQVSATTIPRDRWFCLKGHLAIANAGGQLEVFIDETRVQNLTGIDTLVTSGFATAIAGIEWTSSSQSSAEVLTDEVVVDRVDVGCE